MFFTVVGIVVLYMYVFNYYLYGSNMDMNTKNEVFLFWHVSSLHFLSSLHILVLSFADMYWYSYQCDMLP